MDTMDATSAGFWQSAHTLLLEVKVIPRRILN